MALRDFLDALRHCAIAFALALSVIITVGGALFILAIVVSLILRGVGL